MTESKDLPKKLPPMESEFELEVIGALSGRKYTGKFNVRIMTTKMRAKADIERAKLNGGIAEAQLAPSVAEFHFMIGYLRACLTSAPKWWIDGDHGYDLYDGNVVDAVYEATQKFEKEWMLEVWGPKPEPTAEGANERPAQGG